LSFSTIIIFPISDHGQCGPAKRHYNPHLLFANSGSCVFIICALWFAHG
jgi:hypothetical protein